MTSSSTPTKKEATLPVEGKAIRFAPSRDGEPAAAFWKVWAEENELYASSRIPGGSPKISVHASGQIHYRIEVKVRQDLDRSSLITEAAANRVDAV